MNVRTPPAARALTAVALALATFKASAGGLQPLGLEFPLTRNLPGDQVNPSLALGENGGILVWQDAAVDGQGLGIAGVRLNATGQSLSASPIQINENAAGDQENPTVTALKGGRWLSIWQGGQIGFQKVFGRVLAPDGTPLGSEFQISSGSGSHQIDPVCSTLSDGSVVVAWSSFKQEDDQGYAAFARLIDGNGAIKSDEFRLNATFGLGRRTPALAPLADGGFFAAWVSERQVGIRNNLDDRGRPVLSGGAPAFAVTLVGRPFHADGTTELAEREISTADSVAANPALLRLSNDSLLVVWTKRQIGNRANGLDIASRVISATGIPQGEEALVNVATYGDQYRPRLAATPHGTLCIWTSMGQDGSWEGVYGRWIGADGRPNGDEIEINTQKGGGQLMPAVATGPEGELLVAWSSNLPRVGFELFAQRLMPLKLKVDATGTRGLRLRWATVRGESYRVESSQDGQVWKPVAEGRTALGDEDSVEVPAVAKVVLYRVVRVR